jgi:hypothetical protein
MYKSRKMKRKFFISVISIVILTACNKDWSFPDYKYTTVYFPYQSPVRTLVLGKDIYDNSLDNQHKFLIMATMGGVYENKKDITLDVEVDNSLAANLKFGSATGDTVLAMPASYFSLPKGMQVVIPSGKVMGGLEVQLTDAFFADTLSIKNTYVIPLKIIGVTNADSILSGKSDLSDPDRRKAADWILPAKDYVLFAVKYVNPYHGSYLRRGKDEVKGAGGNTSLDTNVVYHAAYVEKDEVCSAVTRTLDQVSISLNAKNKGNVNVPFRMVLSFDGQGKCTITNAAGAAYTISGNGEFVKDGDMWGNEKRDVLRLNYQVDFGTTVHNFTDTIVARDRGVKFETFNPVIVK